MKSKPSFTIVGVSLRSDQAKALRSRINPGERSQLIQALLDMFLSGAVEPIHTTTRVFSSAHSEARQKAST